MPSPNNQSKKMKGNGEPTTPHQKPITMKVICRECGSTDIQVKYWCNPNTFKIIDVSDGEETECWCNNCQDERRCDWIEE